MHLGQNPRSDHPESEGGASPGLDTRKGVLVPQSSEPSS